MRQKILITITFLTLTGAGGLLWSTAQAKTTTTATAAATTDSTASDPFASNSAQSTTDSLKARIDKVIQQQSDKVKGVMDQLGQTKRGFIGEVQRVVEKTVTVKNQNGVQILNITPDIVIVKDHKHATLDDINIGDWAIVMGLTNSQGFTLRRLEISSTTLMPHTYLTEIGTVQTITKTQLTFLARNQQAPETFVLNKNTQFEDAQGNPLTRADIQTDEQYLVIALPDQNGKTVTVLHSLVPTEPSPTPKSKLSAAPTASSSSNVGY